MAHNFRPHPTIPYTYMCDCEDYRSRDVHNSIKELAEAAEQLLKWQPTCSLGSSGDLRQKRLRKALDNLKENQT